MVTDVSLSRKAMRLGAVGPADAVAAVRALLAGAAPASLVIDLFLGDRSEAGEETLDALLLVVTAEEGVTDQMRDQLRDLLGSGAPAASPAPVVAFLDGCDRVPEGQRFVLDLIELDLRGTVADLGLAGESLPVIRGSARQALAAEPAEEWTAAVGALVSALAPAAPAGFRMSIGDIVPTRRGAVVLGRIESGTVHAGAEVAIATASQPGRTVRVRGVMRAWDLVPDGHAGEEVGLFLEKIRLTDFRGVQGLVQPAPPAGLAMAPALTPPLADAADGDDAGYYAVPVFYATDRNRTEDAAPRHVYGGGRSERGELAFGVAEVSLPRRGRRAGAPVPSWWRLEHAEDLARHIVLLDIAECGRDLFVTELRQTVRRADPQEVLVFVHGYDVTFEDAARHAAQLADALDFPGVPILYSWPSEGRAHRYTVDETNVEWSRVHAAELLRLVLAESGARAVHVIAHGMGSRALAWALGELAPSAERGAEEAVLRQVVFAAPDIDRDTFLGLVPRMRDRAEHFTLYGSSNDRALRAARIVHSHPRAGESGDALAVAEGIDAIDAASADTSLQERSGPTILADVAARLRRSLPD